MFGGAANRFARDISSCYNIIIKRARGLLYDDGYTSFGGPPDRIIIRTYTHYGGS